MAGSTQTMTRRALMTAIGFGCLCGRSFASDGPRIGQLAPDFQSRDSEGRVVTLTAFKGKTVVLEWTNPECPYVAKHYDSGAMQALQREMTTKGVVWLTVSSAAAGQVGYLDALEAAALADARKSNATHFLLDHTGQMLADYVVPVALTMAVIAPTGELAYFGAIDDKPTAKLADISGARNYVRAALDAIARGDRPSPAQTRPYGCVTR